MRITRYYLCHAPRESRMRSVPNQMTWAAICVHFAHVSSFYNRDYLTGKELNDIIEQHGSMKHSSFQGRNGFIRYILRERWIRATSYIGK